MNNNIIKSINELAFRYRNELSQKIKERNEEIKNDNFDHILIYKVLGITDTEGKLIDEYQNKGRFLYNYAGNFLQEAAILCFKHKYNNIKEKYKVKNNIGSKPKNFEIDFLVDNKAYEIKWRDATTDGDHIIKEHTRIQVIKNHNFIPIRIMFYYPNREQAKKIQEAIKTLYDGVGGEYYFGNDAWEYIYKTTNINLLKILEDIAYK
ncbi:ApaLI family restriction endonuclease [uncultured Brachyspira sp.]|uniref:ApaLI family restriction endonuclease n=1 Tax=uncultured Brachyspira sp. TaxID=221953 RepID=UPI0025ECA1DE|nr:ApaLI family restriction endonuclease [uncultured Brachyspira sp.]